ncbi:MAG: PRC-barrel domain-containing protein [Nanoarchaeota archaeon]|nr:PRC-barrel domain-containing protein [Nanoarchaeota archaeon]
MKKYLISFLLSLLIIQSASAVLIFSDDFESGNIQEWNKTNSAGARNWTANQTDVFQGSWHAQSQPQSTTQPASVLQINISTLNYQDISLFYYRRLVGIDSADEFQMEWYNGTTWEILESTGGSSANEASYSLKNFNLSSHANDNPYLQIKFECTAGATSEYCRIDNVSLTGNLIPDSIFPNSNLISPQNNSQSKFSTHSFNATFSDNIGLSNASYYLWNSTGSIINITSASLTGLLGSINLSLTLPYEGRFTWNFLATDTSNNFAFNLTNFTINYDSTPPSVTNLIESPLSPITYIQNQLYQFNSTITDNSGIQSVNLQFNNLNYTPNNISNFWNVSILNLPAGEFPFFWIANDTLGNLNSSQISTYTINKADSQLNLTLNESEGNITINQGTSILINGTRINGDSTATLQIYNNGSLINSGESQRITNLSNFTAIGLYNITLLYLQSQNYSANSKTYYVNVIPVVDLSPPSFTLIPSNISVSYPGDFAVNFEASDNSAISTFKINWTDLFQINNSGYLNNTKKLAAGIYLINVSVNDSSGNVNSTIYSVNVLQNDTFNISINISPNNTVIFPSQTNVSILNCPIELECNLFKNNISISNPEILLLSAGNYHYLLNTSGNSNYSSKSISSLLTISKGEGKIYTYINNSRSNITIQLGTSIFLNSSLINGTFSSINLSQNSIQLNSSINQNITYTQLFNSIGTFIINSSYSGNENYSSSSESWFVTVTDFQIPSISLLTPQNTTYNTNNLQLNYSVSDNNLDSCWYTENNGQINTTLTNCQNISYTASQNSTTIKIYANDSAGNINSSSVAFFVDSILPLISFTSPTQANNSIFSQNSIFINVSVIETNEANITFSLHNSTSLVNLTTFITSQRTINFSNLGDGVYFYNVTIKDSLNNQNTTETRTLTIDTTPPSISIVSPQNTTYTNDTILINISSNGNNIWFYNGTANESYTFPVYRILDGSNLLIAYANDSLGNVNSSSVIFYTAMINIYCEVGGPYQQGALILVQGNLTNKTSPISNQQINLSIYKNNLLNQSKLVETSNDGSFEASFNDLSLGNYTLNATSNYLNLNNSCIDNFQIGSTASLIFTKIATIHNTTNDTINYNITLQLANNGGADSLNTNISDSDSELSPYIIGKLSPSSKYEISYIKNFTRKSSLSYYLTSKAIASGVDSYSNTLISQNTTQINLTIPSTQVGKQIIIIKNIIYISENSLNVTYNITSVIYNSGDEDLIDINYIDTDFSSSAVLLNLTKSSSKSYYTVKIIDKAASNTQHEFALGSATIDLVSFYSNRPKINIPGYGGPADVIVYAPESIPPSSNSNFVIEVKNANIDIGQDFTTSYWITDDQETINYSAGQITIYIGANSSVNNTITLSSPLIQGSYKLKASTSWAGGTASSFDTFLVISSEETPENPSQGSSSSSSGSSSSSSQVSPKQKDQENQPVPETNDNQEIICNPPYIRHGLECCLDQNSNNICDEDEKSTPDEPKKSGFFTTITGFITNNIINADIVNKIIIPTVLIIIIILITLYIIKRIKKKPKDKKSLKSLIGLKVFTSSGMEIGTLKDIILANNKIDSIKIKLSKKLRKNNKIKTRGISIKYKHVQNIRQIAIINEKILEEIK